MNTATDRLSELRKLIARADEVYYGSGTGDVEDALYDKRKDELAQLAPDDILLARVGAEVHEGMLQKREHRIPMGSQSKATNREEFKKWTESAGREQLFHASYKMDGGSFSFEYRDGRLFAAISRGDGAVGEDITGNALSFQGLPKICSLRGAPFLGFMRGEVVLHLDDWKEIDPDMLKNPRNCAVGIARRKSGDQSEMLTVYAFRLFGLDGEVLGETEQEQADLMAQIGFNTAPSCLGTAEEIWSWFEKTQKDRPTLPYWIDGIVVKVNDLRRQIALGETDNRPKGQVSVKFEAGGAVSTLRSVSVGLGHSGVIVPVGNFDPVQIGGTTVKSATLCNWENIQHLGLGIGDKVRIIKAGDIIPRVMEVIEKAWEPESIPEPTNCPVCQVAVGRKSNISGEESRAIYCLNSDCSAKLSGKIQRFLTAVDILGIGDNLIEALIREMGVHDAADLFRLHERGQQLASLRMSGKVKLGEKRAAKCLAAMDKAKRLPLSKFLGALGIFQLAERRIEIVQQPLPGEFDTLEDWLSGKLIEMAQLAKIPKMAARFQQDLLCQRTLIEKFLANGLEITKSEPVAPTKTGALTICITGKLSQPKAYFWDLIAKAGHKSTDDFSKSVTHLVADDPNGSSSKLQKARKMGISVLSEAQLLELLVRP